ncbi:hypothetical protein [Phenylobacterium sp.]|uniref:helix-turn-helix transcriptional regulator n=1 Tax=Phenylobacterium sp. TaxID=1871053 RepID=UPI0030F3A6ED
MDTQSPGELRPLPSDPETLITRRDVPLYVPVASQTLAKLAVIGGGPRYVRVGRRAAYRAGDLKTWLDSRSRLNTSSCHGL